LGGEASLSTMKRMNKQRQKKDQFSNKKTCTEPIFSSTFIF